MSSSAKKSTLVRSVISIQIVHYCCSNCGEEVEEMKVCRSCKAPMNVITVLQKYGEEAEKYLEELKGKQSGIKTDANLEDIDSVGVDNSLVPDEDLEEGTSRKHGNDVDFEKEFEDMAKDLVFDVDEEDDDGAMKTKKPVTNQDISSDLDKIDEGLGLSDDDMKNLDEL